MVAAADAVAQLSRIFVRLDRGGRIDASTGYSDGTVRSRSEVCAALRRDADVPRLFDGSAHQAELFCAAIMSDAASSSGLTLKEMLGHFYTVRMRCPGPPGPFKRP
jgi:hypothetical protein